MVQGGYNVALAEGDSVERHFMDTIEGGKWLSDQELAWTLVSKAVERIHELENELGCFFDRNPDGTVHQKAFAGQTFDRTVHKGDLTGIEIINRLAEQVWARGINRLEEHRAIELIHSKDGKSLAGVLMLNMQTGQFVLVRAKAVLLATGGGPTMYKYHTPSGDKSCDGLAMALRAGLVLRDMEMVQFHPTGVLAGAGTRITGSAFTVYRGAGARLERALINFLLDLHSTQHGYTEISPPLLVKPECLVGTGQLPKFADDAYAIERDDLWAIPTAEVPLTSIYAGEVLDEAELPKRMMAHTSCYRREAGSAGRDTRGMLRAHEFDKVEILAVTTPEQGPAMLQEIVDRAERLISGLGLPYRIIEICTGDMGQSHHRSFDIEVYAPGCDNWLEVSSCSWFSDYQARRGDIRFKKAGEKGTTIANTLNGSALAVPRVWAAIVENYRQADGTVVVPEALRPYMRGIEVIGA